MAGGDARQAGEELGPWLRARDPDRFLCALFAPPDRRWALFALYGFNHELARAREVAAEPTLALIRLAWWREVLAGAERRHFVATPLRAALAAGLLDA
ncbi:MAG: squalene/phytoene synthase family protein, partial [Acetobacteraceae bacterium]